jgi:hypothetical protein
MSLLRHRTVDFVGAEPTPTIRLAASNADVPILAPDRVVITQQLKVALFLPILFVVPLFTGLGLGLALVGVSPILSAIVVLLFLIAGLVGACRLLTTTMLFVMRRMRSWVLEEVERKHGPLPLVSQYVGVAYSDQVWSVNGDTSWDFGALEVGNGSLRFFGRKSDFVLPFRMITSLRLQPTPIPFSKPLTKFQIQWLDPEGKIQHVAIEIRDASSPAAMKAETEELRERIERWRNTPSLNADFEVARLPLRIEDVPLKAFELGEASRTAKIVGIVVGLATAAGVEAIGWAVRGPKGAPVTLLVVAGLSTYFCVLTTFDLWLQSRNGVRDQEDKFDSEAK